MVEKGGNVNTHEALTNEEQKLLDALTRMYELYKGDGELVRPGAEKHGVRVIKGSVFDKPVRGNYNFRLMEPTVESVRALGQVRSIAVVCEDYRQFAEVVEGAHLNPGENEDAVFGVAGGSAQPNNERRVALVDVVAMAMGLNPEMQLMAAIHTGVCGGAEHFTGGEMSKLNPAEESQKMVDFRSEFVNELVAKGVSQNRINVGTAIVEGHNFIRFE